MMFFKIVDIDDFIEKHGEEFATKITNEEGSSQEILDLLISGDMIRDEVACAALHQAFPHGESGDL